MMLQFNHYLSTIDQGGTKILIITQGQFFSIKVLEISTPNSHVEYATFQLGVLVMLSSLSSTKAQLEQQHSV